MSVLGSQVDVDMEESVPDPVPKHQGHTGTGCYKLHDHEFMRPREQRRPARKGGGGPPPSTNKSGGPAPGGEPANLMDLPVLEMAAGPGQHNVNATKALKQHLNNKQRTPVSIKNLCMFILRYPLLFQHYIHSRTPWIGFF